MATKQALMTTTSSNRLNLSGIPTLLNFKIVESVPSGTLTRYVIKRNDSNWQKYDTANKTWVDVATQALTPASVIAEGNTAAEINAIPAGPAMVPFVGKTLDVAAGMQTTNNVLPTIQSFTVNGQSGSSLYSETKDYPAIVLNKDEAVDIISIKVEKTETGKGTVAVQAAIQDANGNWGGYQDYTAYLGKTPTQAKAIKFRATFTVVDIGKDAAKLNSIEVASRSSNDYSFTEGTSFCVTKTYDFNNIISRAHLTVKHETVQDTKLSAQISLRNPPITVKSELLGTGDGKQHTVKLKQTNRLASHGFALYFDGAKQEQKTYSYSPTDGQVTYTAAAGVTVTADYIYGWENENFVEMTLDGTYPDRTNKELVTDQFSYDGNTSDRLPTGSVVTVRVMMEQEKGHLDNVALGKGTGQPVSYKLAHHATVGKIKVLPETATWKYKENTDYLTVTAPADADATVSYDWAARPLALNSLVCVFDE